ncbi:MAG: hypothetical protein PHV16_04990 [Candidatus Nanoarchaeia archaeon]|nr:hypothetical protein [Candidatus Nanoarchaeia archaeon]
MEKKEIVFLVSLFIAFSLLLYFIGTSITGYVVQSMYCEDGICKEFCKFNSDCSGKEICCQLGDFGVCEELSACESPYSFQPKMELQLKKTPNIENPANITQGKIVLYLVTGFLVVLIGAIYFLGEKEKN